MPAAKMPTEGTDVEQVLLDHFKRGGLHDNTLNHIVYDETAPHLTKPGEREFLELVRKVLLQDPAVRLVPLKDAPLRPVEPTERRKYISQFLAMNGYKIARFFGLEWGPSFIDYVPFPMWRPAFWTVGKLPNYVSYMGVAPAEHGKHFHPYDIVVSSRYHNCIMIQETPVPEIHAGEDYVAHHKHGLHMLARLLTLSFIDIDTSKRTFRFYCVQGCSRLYHWDELAEPDVAEAFRTKVIVKGRVPRTRDFTVKLRDSWSDGERGVLVQNAQRRIISAMPYLEKLLPIKMKVTELVPRCIINIAPIVVAAFLDGRSGMSYGFLAFQLPTGPVDKCNKVTVLVTRSGCDKQNPHPVDDWVQLSFDPDSVALEMSKALAGVTSPSFDSWLILSQAATNLSLARRFKAAGRSPRYVDMVENQGVALCHFHGFVERRALPPNVAFFGQDRMPLPCGSIESAVLTIEEKNLIADKVIACEEDIDYRGDIHVEPDHGCVISTDFDTLEQLASRAEFGLRHFETYKCPGGACCGARAPVASGGGAAGSPVSPGVRTRKAAAAEAAAAGACSGHHANGGAHGAPNGRPVKRLSASGLVIGHSSGYQAWVPRAAAWRDQA